VVFIETTLADVLKSLNGWDKFHTAENEDAFSSKTEYVLEKARKELVYTHGLMMLSRKVCRLTTKSLQDDATDWFSEVRESNQDVDARSFMCRCMKKAVCKILDLDSESTYSSACVFTLAIDDLS
jgi:hypothetical protein